MVIVFLIVIVVIVVRVTTLTGYDPPLYYSLTYSIPSGILRYERLIMSEFKVRENRIRRKLIRMGYRLIKSRRRDPQAYDYGGYMIVDECNRVVSGTESGLAFELTLDNVEDWIKQQ